jgi:hypothetical protein
MPIPWDKVIIHGPKVIDVATSFLDKWKSRPKPELMDPNADVKTQLLAVTQRLQALEDAETAQAEVVKNIAEQMQGLLTGLSELSRKTNLAIWLASGALVVSAAALIVSLLR